ncbi:hypothetical protein C2S51_014897 [Perilla frutescens var. frutescens]|nr:hypothetical protein C2S51_014897 [Perilla frutescens var. frutescens]
MAAAYAALLSLLHNLDLIQNHPRHNFSFEKEQIGSLFKCAIYLLSFMQRWDHCHCCRIEGAEALERRIARAAHAAEDVIESHVVDQIRGGSTLTGKITTSRFLLNLQKVIEDMDFLCRKASHVVEVQRGFKVELPAHWETATSSTSLTSVKKSNTMVGFDGVLLQLLDMLTNGEPSNRQVIPIVGMAGIGKTTLATNAFQHSYIVRYFDVCLWATISQQYSVEKILLELASCMRNSSGRTVDELGEELYKSLYARRYLIVLDDMWSAEAWDGIKFFFPDTSNGSRIVVTTRESLLVAHHLSTSHFKMGFLDEGKSWDLFCQKAFAEQVCPLELEEIGKKMVEKCKGLPLAIVVLGGYFRKSSKTLEHWEKVANHMNLILSSAENERCLNILYLSYSYLLVHLKPCFLFMGVFPEDDRILVSDMLQLWIAEGFIQPRPCECCSLEHIAMAYLRNLVERNLILVVKHGLNGNILECKIHDLVRELCLKIAKEEEFFEVLDTARARIMNSKRRVVINHEQAVPEVNHEPQRSARAPAPAPRVRSLICEGGRLPLDLKLLRVVNKVNRALANEVNFQQVNLRYLNIVLDYKSDRTLYIPSSISLLWKLQTLKISGNYQSIIAPYEIWEMPELRHIEVDPLCLVNPLPMDECSDEEAANDMVLRNLQTLKKVENLRLSKEVCKRIPNIQELEVSYCDLGRGCDEARSYYYPHNLVCFHNLDSLVCKFDSDSKWHDFALSLTFPTSLQSLSLIGSRLDWEDLTTMVGSLPHLEKLVLKSDAVIGSEWNPVEGGFPHLKSIDIHDCDDLVYWNADSSHFPVLEHVHLKYLSKLDELPSDIGEIPTLGCISLDCCSAASTISAMKIMVEQEELGNEDLHLRVRVQGDEETLESYKQMIQNRVLQPKIYLCVSKI